MSQEVDYRAVEERPHGHQRHQSSSNYERRFQFGTSGPPRLRRCPQPDPILGARE